MKCYHATNTYRRIGSLYQINIIIVFLQVFLAKVQRNDQNLVLENVSMLVEARTGSSEIKSLMA